MPDQAQGFTRIFSQAWTSPARLDLRSLAMLRIGLGVTSLVDLAIRVPDLEAHYSPLGVYPCAPRSSLQETWRGDLFPCDTGLPWPTVHFALHGLLALGLLLGFRTRWMTLLVWVFAVSLHNRNPTLLIGGDSLLRCLLLAGLFLPLGERWSLDAWLARRTSSRKTIHSWATWMYLIQVLLVYPTVLWHRRHEPAWWDGTALQRILDHDLFANRLGIALRSFDTLLAPSTYAAVGLEMLGPVLVLLPIFGRGWLRSVVVLSFIFFHIGIGALVNVGVFPLVSVTSWLGLLPCGFWDFLRRTEPSEPEARLDALTPGDRLSSGLAYVLLLFTFVWNVGLANAWLIRFPPSVNAVGELLRLEQSWHLFSSMPSTDGWYVLAGETTDGRHVDLMRAGAPVTWEKPEYVLAQMPSRRWAKTLTRLQNEKHANLRGPFTAYYGRAWNQRASCSDQLMRVELLFVPEGSGAQAKRSLSSLDELEFRAGCRQ